MKSFTFDVVVFGGPASVADRQETKFKVTFKAESCFSAVCSMIGIFSGCKWFAVRGYVDTPNSDWLQYVTFYDNDSGFTHFCDCNSVA